MISTEPLTALVDRAAGALYGARNSAEIIDAIHLAGEAYTQARRLREMAKAKKAHDDLIDAVHRVEGDALIIKAKAESRLADEYDAAQKRGEVATSSDTLKKGPVLPDGKDGKPTTADIGLTHKQIHRARKIRNAEKIDPGVVQRTVDEAIAAGEEPTANKIRVAVQQAVGWPRKKTNERDRQIAEMNLVADINALKKAWSTASIAARRQLLRDIGIGDTAIIEPAIRNSFKRRNQRREKLTLPSISSLKNLDTVQ